MSRRDRGRRSIRTCCGVTIHPSHRDPRGHSREVGGSVDGFAVVERGKDEVEGPDEAIYLKRKVQCRLSELNWDGA
jgi:hypothetical protein